jgi:hypothetical protein
MKIGIYVQVVVKQKKLLLHHGKVDVKVLLQGRIIINLVVKQEVLITLVENVMQKYI